MRGEFGTIASRAFNPFCFLLSLIALKMVLTSSHPPSPPEMGAN